MPTVSVILPTHNRAAWLARALGSVAAQACRDYELIVIDDGSTDATPEVVARLAPAATCVALPDVQGPSAARNAGLQQARGTFIAFLDSDDEWMPQHLDTCLARFARAEESVGLVFSGYQIVDGHGRILAVRRRDPLEGAVLPELLANPHTRRLGPSCSSALVRASALERVGRFDPRLESLEDWELWVRLAARYRFAYSGSVSARVMGHRDNHLRDLDRMAAHRLRAIDIVRASPDLGSEAARWEGRLRSHVHLGLGWNYYELGRMAAARAHLAQAIRAWPRQLAHRSVYALWLKSWLGVRLSRALRQVRGRLYHHAVARRFSTGTR